MGRSAPRLLVSSGFVVAAIAFAWPLPLHMATHLTGSPGGDTGVYVWNQWLFQHELLEAGNPLTTTNILALTPPVDLSQHNYTVFLNVLALPLIPWFGVITAFNVVFLALCVINAVAAYRLARVAMGVGRWEAWLAGVAFAWSPVLTARSTGHFSLVAAAPLAAFMCALIVAERSRRRRHAAIAGACMAWAALCDPYFAVYCLMIAGLYIATTIVRVRLASAPSPVPFTWLLDVLLISTAGLVIGMLAGARGVFSVMGVSVSVRELYTPMLMLTVLAGIRLFASLRPRLEWLPRVQLPAFKLTLIAVLACAGPLSPVLFGLGRRVAEGGFVSPKIFWRSSPVGVDLLGLLTPNPNHAVVRWLGGDVQSSAPAQFVEYVASLSLVALAVVSFAVWRSDFRPKPGWWWVTGGFAALALGPFIHVAGYNTHIPGPWALLRYMPVISIARTPSRFAIVAALGLAILLAGALASLAQRWPHRRRILFGVATAGLLLELSPMPRTLHSATISPIYDTIALDPRPVRVLTLPFGVRDGTSSVGNFNARSQFNQTRHGKALIGGYLSRISTLRVGQLKSDFPTLAVLIKLSQNEPINEADRVVLADRGDDFVRRSHLGYVVLDQDLLSASDAAPVIAALGLREIERDRQLILYAAGDGLPR